MKSPVSLSTGVTYDRSSIQRWLDTGNNTCPATMQVLQTKEFVPNRNLQRLIQIWSDSVHHRRNSQRVDSASNSVVPSQDEIKLLVKDIENNRCCFDALSKFICFAGESEENREFLAKLEGFVPMLVDFLGDYKKIDFLEQVIKVIDMILIKIGDDKQLLALFSMKKKNNLEILSSLLVVLQRGKNVQSRIGSVRILESIAMDAESKLLIADKDGILSELVKSIGLETDSSLIEASLSCLIAISKAKRVKLKLIADLKIIPALKNILAAEEPISSSIIIEKALKLLETVSSCKEGRAEMCIEAGCVEAVVQKVLKVSAETTEHAVTILWSVCYLFRDVKARDAVAKSNGLAKLLLLMQSNCSPAVRQMAKDLLKIFRVNSKSCFFSYETKTTHIMPF